MARKKPMTEDVEDDDMEEMMSRKSGDGLMSKGLSKAKKIPPMVAAPKGSVKTTKPPTTMPSQARNHPIAKKVSGMSLRHKHVPHSRSGGGMPEGC